MSLDDFRTIIDKTKRTLTNVILHNQGEPTLNDKIFDMISYARSNRIRTIMSTNLTLFGEEVCEGIIKSGLDTLIASVDGVTEETYQKYRIGGHFEAVYRNLERLVEMKRRLRRRSPHIVWSFLIFKHNVHEVEEAARLAMDLGVEFFIQSAGLGGTIHPWQGDEKLKGEWLSTEEWVPRYFDYDPARGSICKGPCDWLWNSLVVFWDGTVSPCCFVDEERFSFGNILEDELCDIWNNEQYRAARSLFRRKWEQDTGEAVICNACRMFEKE